LVLYGPNARAFRFKSRAHTKNPFVSPAPRAKPAELKLTPLLVRPSARRLPHRLGGLAASDHVALLYEAPTMQRDNTRPAGEPIWQSTTRRRGVTFTVGPIAGPLTRRSRLLRPVPARACSVSAVRTRQLLASALASASCPRRGLGCVPLAVRIRPHRPLARCSPFKELVWVLARLSVSLRVASVRSLANSSEIQQTCLHANQMIPTQTVHVQTIENVIVNSDFQTRLEQGS